MNILLDHCVWKETQDILQKAGFKCTTLRQLGKTEAANGEVIAIAKAKKAVLITRDRDFANTAIYPLGSHDGIVLLRITPKSINEVHKILLEAIRVIPAKNFKGNLLIITSATYRLHKHKH